MLPIIERVFSACEIKEIHENKKNRQEITCIINNISCSSTLKSQLIKIGLIKYFKLICISETDEIDNITTICRLIVSHDEHYPTILKFLCESCVILNKLDVVHKLQAFHHVLACILQLTKIGQTTLESTIIAPISEYISNFLVFSNPIHTKAITLLSVLVNICPLNIYYESLKCKTHIDLVLNLCLVELQMILEDAGPQNLIYVDFSSEIRSYIYLTHACIFCCEEYHIFSEKTLNQMHQFRIYLNEFIQKSKDLNSDLMRDFFQLLCALWTLPNINFEYCQVNIFSINISRIMNEGNVDEIDLTIWITDFLKTIHKEGHESMISDTLIINVVNSCGKIIIFVYVEEHYPSAKNYVDINWLESQAMPATACLSGNDDNQMNIINLTNNIEI
ncbi:hypothetical protein MXB_4513 [Myxobolus squamalis]|nr:hypothetical protein MXB_4513 [Myxobolus squamalis]